MLGKNTRGVHDLELRARILGATGVAGLPVYRSVLDGETRRLAVQATVATVFGPAALATAVFVAAPVVPANLIPVPLQGYDALFLFGPGGEELLGFYVPPRVHDGEANRVYYGALLDDDGALTDGFSSVLISALGVMPAVPPLPVDALVDGFGEPIEDGFFDILVSGTGLADVVPLPPTAAAISLDCVGTALAAADVGLHRPELELFGSAVATQRADVHRPQLAAVAAGTSSQGALLRILAFTGAAASDEQATLAAGRAQALPGIAAASQAMVTGRISNPAHVLTGGGVAAGAGTATLHAKRAVAAAHGAAAGLGEAALTGVMHLAAPGAGTTAQTVILSI